MASSDLPEGRTGRVDLLMPGFVSDESGVASSCSLVVDGERLIVVDPGMAPDDDAILVPLRALGVEPDEVTDVVISHHHPDHTVRVGLFPNAAVHDHWATYRGTDWQDADADRRELSPSVRLLKVPGHTPEDVATVVGTADGIVVLTHLWWSAAGPPEDHLATVPEALHGSRARVLAIADRIVPGHGPAFAPDATTPR